MRTLLHFFYTLLAVIFLIEGAYAQTGNYRVIAIKKATLIHNSIVGKRPLNVGDPVPYGSLIETDPNGEAILQKGDSFVIVQITRNTRVRLDYRGLHQLSHLIHPTRLFQLERYPVRFIPTQATTSVPTLPVDTFDLEEGAIIGNFSEPVAINTVLGYAYMDGTVPTQLYVASFAGNGRPSRAVPRARTTHKVLWYQKEGKGEIKPKPKVLKQVLDPKKGDKIPPDNTVRSLFDAAEAELIAQSEIARLLTPEDMEEEPITGFPEPRFDKVQPDITATGDFFGQVNTLSQAAAQNLAVQTMTGMPSVNPISNELANNPQQTINSLATILGVPLPANLSPQQINALINLAQNLPPQSTADFTTILNNQTLSEIVPQLTPPATTPF
ncbi:MAG: hypothetical protein RML49_05820 [Verrucomicrobiae bacterium]|nr:hypothetical protein [Verrucomicrobiae bacterium]